MINKNWLEELQAKQLKETEEHLIQLGLVKCEKSGQWESKNYLDNDGTCCQK